MTVEFRPSNPQLYSGKKLFSDGTTIYNARFDTSKLPIGTPTQQFNPAPSGNRSHYEIACVVDVQPNQVTLRGYHSYGTIHQAPTHTIRHSQFPNGELPITMWDDATNTEHDGVLLPK